MNNKSVICKFIAENPDNWEELLSNEYTIKVKKEGDYAIFNYAIESDFRSPIVQEARGIIIDYVKKEVVCWPFRKFGNYTEGYADEIDWQSARVLEKVDGSIIKLWFDGKKGEWNFSTNGMIYADKALIDGLLVKNSGFRPSYFDIIKRADNFRKIPFETLNKEYTYIFELVSPETRVVIKYETASLYHLGTRSNISGEEFEIDIGIKKPKSYPLSSLEDCIGAVKKLNKEGVSQSDDVENEGFVVVDKNWHRVKIKSPDYVMMHRVSSMKTISKKECLILLIEQPENLDSVIKNCPQLLVSIKYYDYKLEELKSNADKMAIYARNLFAEFSGDRGAVAKVIAKHPLSFVGFKALEDNRSGREILLSMLLEKISKLIPDYEPKDIFEDFV